MDRWTIGPGARLTPIGLLVALFGAPIFAIVSDQLFGKSPSLAIQVPLQLLYCAMAADMPFGLLTTAFYLWRRDLVATMIAHSGGLAIAMVTLE